MLGEQPFRQVAAQPQPVGNGYECPPWPAFCLEPVRLRLSPFIWAFLDVVFARLVEVALLLVVGHNSNGPFDPPTPLLSRLFQPSGASPDKSGQPSQDKGNIGLVRR